YNGNPYVLMSPARAQALQKGWRKPMPVTVQINRKPDKPWRINMMPIGDGSFYLYLHGNVRKASKTRVGDTVTVDVAFDEQYYNGPMHPMPDWFQKGLNENVKANKAWKNLIPSRQKEILRYFSGLKSPQAKERNLQKALHVLSGHDDRFMARTWKDGK
ncbi:MAG: hypothetical protein JWO35_419, partial [Candidatus Saccharibacteria bacterium]|nr:hypothetical protein [Candidatus Saccharibacteria bacterium]